MNYSEICRKRWLFTIWLYLPVQVFYAQNTDSISRQLDTITISVQRLETSFLEATSSISVVQTNAIQTALPQQSLGEYLYEIPGLLALNSGNFAQDMRVSIRGFGSRSAFGIRGVKLIVDGIPETTPDGQGQVDNLDLGLIEKIEVLRGPSSGLYGNASGGVIQIETLKEFKYNFVQLRAVAGSFGLQQYRVGAGWRMKKSSLVVNGTLNQTDGFRMHSAMQQAAISANFRHQLNPKTSLRLLFNFTDSPKAEDPGAIDLERLTADRRQARPLNLQYQAGEAIRQFKTGLRIDHRVSENGHLQAQVFINNRQFDGLLPFLAGGSVALDRRYAGLGLNYRSKQTFFKRDNHFQIGFDWHTQRDDRQQFSNLDGKRGLLSFHQVETFSNLGIYVVDQVQISKRWHMDANLRFDINRLEAEDQIRINGDESGTIPLNSLNGGLGMSYRVHHLFSPFIRFSTSFETPALSELSANPTGGEGFNASLQPQTARSLEGGFRGLNDRWRYEGVLFWVETQDEIVPYELTAFPGRNFYRNAGETRRLGFETQLSYAVARYWRASLNYAYSDFIYQDYELTDNTLNGQQLPGIPRHQAAASLQYIHPLGLLFRWQSRLNGALFVDDANTIKDDAYLVHHLNGAYTIGKREKNWRMMLIFGINNLLDAKYNDNIRINAFGGQYFEPAPGINFFGGIQLNLGKVESK
ncbi:MAG TPA: TonB-dependent receptor [Saprospiraceae bacterium]|nr:TonB-dependent receptor [Saprospiraceae bacterium]HMQ84835.1 TonB-dependent receptor [Saprospiraceae bacterium]